ncbi:hypothetical protein HF086_006795 [Spodoptera exigua]|uniref:Uncharacterized protein n=1 Tax=Spodoptera exigua TaxID=7107 RepID=A0A922M1D3_SPOEX|nr:hypothetical protein HF086_006795 [Spodoptera exigua]
MSLTSLLMESGSGETSTTVRDSELTSKTRFSNFGGGDCGEPFTPQHLQLDFTPNPEEKQPSLVPQRTEVPITSPPESKPNKEKNLEMDQSAISSLEIYSKPGYDHT